MTGEIVGICPSKAPLCKGGWQNSLIFGWGIVTHRYITIPPSRLCRATSLCTREALDCRIQHIFDENAISGGGVVDEDVGDCADQFAVLDNW